MIIVVGFVALALWALTVRDILRRRDITGRRRVTWAVVTLFLPLFAIPAYWLVKPQPRKPATPAAAREPRAWKPTDWIPGWVPELPGSCEEAWRRACQGTPLKPGPGLYVWLRTSGFAEKHPTCAAKLLRCILGRERRQSFAACPEIGALTRLLEPYVGSEGDLRAVREELRRLCPDVSSVSAGPLVELPLAPG